LLIPLLGLAERPEKNLVKEKIEVVADAITLQTVDVVIIKSEFVRSNREQRPGAEAQTSAQRFSWRDCQRLNFIHSTFRYSTCRADYSPHRISAIVLSASISKGKRRDGYKYSYSYTKRLLSFMFPDRTILLEDNTILRC
jgi:hypothetical protein